MRAWCKVPVLLLLLLAVAVLFAGCGGDGGGEVAATDVAVGSFVGLVDDTDAYIAVVSDGKRLAGYVCDGKTVSIWFKGDVGDHAAGLRARTEQELGEVQFLGDTADGEIEIGGERRSFSAEIVVGDAGLYTAYKKDDEGTVEVGWVVLNDGSQRGATNFVDPLTLDRSVQPAPMLDPKTAGVSVNVGGNAIQLAQNQVGPMFIDPIINGRR
jgi:hypothetical protein